MKTLYVVTHHVSVEINEDCWELLNRLGDVIDGKGIGLNTRKAKAWLQEIFDNQEEYSDGQEVSFDEVTYQPPHKVEDYKWSPYKKRC